MSTPSQVESIFNAAIDEPSASKRAAYLDRACGDDDALRRRVERLLNAHSRAEGFLAKPVVDRAGPGSHPESISPVQRRGEDLGDTLPYASDEDALSCLQPPERPGSLGRLAHYEVLAILGTGSFGTVVKAFDEKLRRLVAIKILSPGLTASWPPSERYMREARSAAAVRHENVIAIYSVEDHPVPYLVMEYIAGRTLQQMLDATGPLDLKEVLRIGAQTAAGLAAAHATGLIHRDIKPGNILLGDGAEHVKLTDFGLALGAEDSGTNRSGYIAGTPMYMAPEQALGETVTRRSDLFSLGSVLYAMCTGRPPFVARNALATIDQVARGTPRPIREINPDIPEWLADLISRLHARAPADRTASAQDVADLLAGRLAELQPPSRRELSPSKAKPEPPSRRRWIAAAAIPILIAGMGLSEAAGITDVGGTVVRLFSPDGTLVVEVDDPGVSVQIEGADLVIHGAGAHEIRVKPGRYSVHASKDGKLVRRQLVDITRNGRNVVRVSQEPAGAASSKDDPKVASAEWERSVAGLPAVEMVKAVALRMQTLNPGFDGSLTTKIEQGAVTELKFTSDHVNDISPLRVLTQIRSLNCSGSDAFDGHLVNGTRSRGQEEGQIEIRAVARSRLSDLSPLRGMPLTRLSCVNTDVHDLSPLSGMKLTVLQVPASPVQDLSPLAGMPLEELDCGYTKVADLAPLKGMTLTVAQFEETQVADLSPLKGMKLQRLSIGRNVSDLSPLAGMPLQELGCRSRKVSDISPLAGMPLQLLWIDETQVADLSPLRDMHTLRSLISSDPARDLSPLKGLPLSYLRVGSQVTDLSPLREIPLARLRFDAFVEGRDAEILRGMKTLQSINDIPVAQLWKQVEQRSRAKP